MSNYALLSEIRRLLKGNVERNQAATTAVFASILESILAGIDATVDIVEITAPSYTASARNSTILADTTLNNIDVYLPPADSYIDTSAGTTKLLYIKKADDGPNSVTIHAVGTNTIEGVATYDLLLPLQGVVLVSDGNDYFILSTVGTAGGGGGGSGDVIGPASSTDNAVVRFNGSTGKLIQNSAVTISDTGDITTAGTVDGRDVSADGAALDAHIAAANPHSGSLSTAHEGAGGAVHATAVASGAAGFMSGADKAKLDGIEALADVTDATNVSAAGAVMDSDFAGSSIGVLRRTGVGTYEVLQDNLTASVAPTISDDSSTGYATGSLWVDTVANNVYVCADAGAGAAVWRQIGSGSGTSDHGALTGLADDDHTQYLLVSGVRAMTGSLDMGTNAITNVGNVDGRDVSADGAKLDTIETNADVTDATNVAAAGAVMDSDFAGSSVGVMRRTGVGSYAVLQDNLTAVTGPTASDDTTTGYAAGSLWVDTVANQVYVCADAGAGTAVWRQIGAGGGVTDHGALTGLGDDDHTQYLLVAGTRAMTGNLDMGTFAITNVGNVDGRDVSADGAKLDTIESGADVTDSANVNAAGAVMESDYTPSHSLLAQQAGTGSPTALTVGNSTILGRAAGGAAPIAALTASEAKTILDIQGVDVEFTPNGDIAAITVQDAIVEVRDDTDTKLSSKVDLAGQLGGTVASPDVRGLRETSGPTLLTLGSVADGEYLRRVGSTLVGGTPAGGGGGDGIGRIELVEGFTTADYYSASGIAPGSAAGFTAVWYGLIQGYAAGVGQYLFSRYLSGQGWALQVGGSAGGAGEVFLTAYMRDGTTDLSSSFGVPPGLIHFAMVYDGTTLRAYLNGCESAFAPTGTGFTAAATDLIIGMTPVWNEPHTQGGAIGAGYVESALTAQQLQAHLQACRDAGNSFAAGGITWDHRYDAANTGAGFPTTWEDLAGAGDLSRVGTGITGTTLRAWETGVVQNISGAVAATDVSFDPTGTGLVATDVQAAIAEVAASGGGGTTYVELHGTWDPTTGTYTIPTGTDLEGNATGFEIYVVVRHPLVRGTVSSLQTLISTTGQFSGDGWELGYTGTRPRYVITDGAFNRLENFTGDYPSALTQVACLGFYSFGFDGVNRFIKQAGSLMQTTAMTGFTPSAFGVALGVHGSLATAADALTDGTILAVAAKTDGVLTDAQHADIVREFLTTGDLPNSGFTSRWSIQSLTAGAAPATIPDEIGTNDFTRVGSGTLFVRSTNFAGIAQVAAV